MVYPISLNLRGRRCVVIGGGRIAEGKVVGLLDAGGEVILISPDLTPRLDALGREGRVRWHARRYRRGDLAGAFLAIAATNDAAANHDVWEEAEAAHVLLNAVDDVAHCHFYAPAIHRQGDLTIAVSTAGKGPALAARLRERLAGLFDRPWAVWLDLLGSLRPLIAKKIPDLRQRTALWYRLVDSDAFELVRRNDVRGARARLLRLIDGREPAPASDRAGTVYLVGAGPGDPGLITARGLDLLRRADVVAYDRLVHPRLLAEAKPGAELLFVGKRSHGDAARQDEINRLLVERARAGRHLVRLKGGDPFVFGRGAEECVALREAGVHFEVVPGVTSAVAAPGAAGIPVTARRYGSAFAVVTGHECAGETDVDWDALARIPTVVVLMGVEALPQIAARLIGGGRDASTPAAVVAHGTLERQRTAVATLGTIAEVAARAAIPAPATLVVGDVVRVRETLYPGARLPELESAAAQPAAGGLHD